ncbi:hypothetical protein FSP39_011281 [Pinctada imbricata]|uniref:E3 ubiquitin-protein ligase APD1-4 middle domain-containing protein n=1 Tax=Pinctada imbricata TaxID=66713 RepID=A0AA88Y3W7_PINIB|nr:hypothetical protein FSP39_011281 [Pinctada imbricata]
MVHGGGSCSGGGFSGGGGGFSGGGFTSGYTYGTSRHYGGSSQADCTCCELCCKGMCVGLGVVVCCRKQSLKRRIGILWGWIVVIIFVSSMATSLGTYGPHQTEASYSDMINMRSGLSTVFCSDVKITSTDSQFDAYILKDIPRIGTGLKNYITKKSTYVPEDKYEYWGFYLLAGSTVEITSCPEDYTLRFFVVRGKKNFEKWKENNWDYDSYLRKYTVDCVVRSSTVFFGVEDTDEHYFIFANYGYQGVSLTATFNLTRTTYDLSNYKQWCRDVRFCQMSYTEGSSETLVVFINSTVNSEGDATFKTECVHRAWLFVILFFLLPVIVGLLATFLLYMKYRDTPTSFA